MVSVEGFVSYSALSKLIYTIPHRLWTPNEAFFIEIINFQAWADIKTNWTVKFWGIWGYFQPNYQYPLWCFDVSRPCLFVNQPLFLQKTPLYPHPQYLFGVYLAAKNQGVSHRVSVVRAITKSFCSNTYSLVLGNTVEIVVSSNKGRQFMAAQRTQAFLVIFVTGVSECLKSWWEQA